MTATKRLPNSIHFPSLQVERLKSEMEQVSGEVKLKVEGVKTLERVDQKLATSPKDYEQTNSSKTLGQKEKDRLLTQQITLKQVSSLLVVFIEIGVN